MTITTIVSDLGLVCIHYDDPKCYRQLAKLFGKTPVEVEQAIWTGSDPIGPAFSRGALTSADFVRTLQNQLGVQVEIADFAQFVNAYCDVFRPIRPVYDMYYRLWKEGVTIAACSNIDTLRHRWIARKGYLKVFDVVVVSHEEKINKPSEELMIRTLDRVGVKAEDTLFIDDRPENLVPAAALGMVTHHFTGSRNLRHFLRQIGVMS